MSKSITEMSLQLTMFEGQKANLNMLPKWFIAKSLRGLCGLSEVQLPY